MWVGSLSNVVADSKLAGWVSVDVGVGEKAGRKVQVKGVGEGARESGWPFCCLLHSGREPGDGTEVWGDLVRGRLQGWRAQRRSEVRDQ